MSVLGLATRMPSAVIGRVLSDLGALAQMARYAPDQLDQMLALGEEIAAIGRSVLLIAERLDERAEAMLLLGERLDVRAAALLEMGASMHTLGERVDDRGAEIVDSATRVVETGSELITVLPALERALDIAMPLEGAIDRFGRLVDRFPGGGPRRPGPPASPSPPIPPTGDPGAGSGG